MSNSAKRRSVSNQYRMEVTAKSDCDKCFGTGIAMAQTPHPNMNYLEITLSVCMCVRVVPRLVADLSEREDIVK